MHNSTHFSGPEGLGQPVAQLEVVMFRWAQKPSSSSHQKRECQRCIASKERYFPAAAIRSAGHQWLLDRDYAGSRIWTSLTR